MLALAAWLPATLVEGGLWVGGDLGAGSVTLVAVLLGATVALLGLIQTPLLVGLARIAREFSPSGLASLTVSVGVAVPTVAWLGSLWSSALTRVTLPSVRLWLMAAGLVVVTSLAVKAAWATRAWVEGLRVWTPRSSWLLVAGLVAVAFAFVVAFGAAVRSSLAYALWLVTAAGFVLAEVTLAAIALALGTLPRARARWHWPLGAALGLPAVLIVLSHLCASASPEATREVLAGRGASSRILWLLQRATDRDQDGFSAWFGGRDCDDSDPRIHPNAMDIPASGLDEDCDGEDATDEGPGAQGPPSPFARSPTEARRLNVVMVCMDAVRADHVSFGGYSRKTTPNLDRLARQSWYFEQAIAPSSTTRETIPALFTGRYPSGIPWERSAPIWQVGRNQRLLTEVLHAAGYRTIAIVDEWLDRFLPSFKRGFDHFEVPYGSGQWVKYGQVAAPYIAYAAIREIEKTPTSKPFFLYAQFEAAHHPYVAHEGFFEFGTREIDRYDGEIAYVDHYVGILIEYLRYTGRLDRTVVVVFADHGEEFGEHGGRQHSHALHVESIHVPLVIRVPGELPARIRERVSLVDVTPTLLDALGLRPEGMDFQGASLFWYAGSEARAPSARDIFSELMVIDQGPPRFRKAIYSGDHKLLWDMNDDTTLLYDVRRDPEERQPIVDEEVRARLLGRLRALVGKGTHRPGK